MSAIPLFHGRIDPEGRFQLADSERDQRRLYFQTLAGQDVEIVVRKERTQRSRDQNAYLHAAVFPPLCDYTGYTLGEIKLILMGECWGWHTVGGHELPVKPHTSDMTVDEARHFIDWVIPWAVEKFDIAIPLPNEVAA